MRLAPFVIAIAASAGIGAAVGQEAAMPLPSELLQPQPLEQRPLLRAPGFPQDLNAPAELPERLRPDAPSAPRVERVPDVTPLESPKEADIVPSAPERVRREADIAPTPPIRPAAKAKAAPRRAFVEPRGERKRAERAAPVRSQPRARAIGRPLQIVPPVAQADVDETAATAFAQEPAALPRSPWPFLTARADSRFQVPAGWW